MKRDREDEIETQTRDLVNCLMLLSKVGQSNLSSEVVTKKQKLQEPQQQQKSRVFVCKTCDRQFPSFQALGGHRASHKKPRLMAGGAADLLQMGQSPPGSPAKAKTHECPVCGLEFAVGQALGGHMRRHRDVMQANAGRVRSPPTPPPIMSVLKKSSSSKRISCLNLDLNLAPPGYQQYDSKWQSCT